MNFQNTATKLALFGLMALASGCKGGGGNGPSASLEGREWFSVTETLQSAVSSAWALLSQLS